jgi:hypothetical protein
MLPLANCFRIFIDFPESPCYRDLQEALKSYCTHHVALEQLSHIVARGFREVYENSKAFCKR